MLHRLKRPPHKHRFVIFEWRSIMPTYVVSCWACECGQRRIETT